jgi:hypothetical protein
VPQQKGSTYLPIAGIEPMTLRWTALICAFSLTLSQPVASVSGHTCWNKNDSGDLLS